MADVHEKPITNFVLTGKEASGDGLYMPVPSTSRCGFTAPSLRTLIDFVEILSCKSVLCYEFSYIKYYCQNDRM